MREGPEIGDINHSFSILNSANSSSYTIGSKNFNEMEEWVERIKSFIQKTDELEALKQKQSKRVSTDLTPFQVCRVLGEGEYRQILLCKQGSTKQAYAVKIVPKKDKKMNGPNHPDFEMEFKVLRSVKNPFIAQLHAAFESPEQIFLVTDYLDGGELYHHITTFGKFPEDRAQFYGAEISLALACLHGHHIVYRDLKLESVLLNRDGHVVISDFALSKSESVSDAGEMAGPVEYLAPETIQGEGTSISSDWWSFGVVLFEMMCGSHPFYSSNKAEMETNIVSTGIKFPTHLSAEAKSILGNLLTREPSARLGTNNSEEILRHAFFAGIDPVKLANCEIAPPYKPEVVDEMDAQLYEEASDAENPAAPWASGL
ncbi:Serine/threonine-protein kinase Sgk1 [Podochytrium sp. JEL0797]|nr:Serine/threonine-protein kinase Sgk1 [Podochytrium sp. JEL0797]